MDKAIKPSKKEEKETENLNKEKNQNKFVETKVSDFETGSHGSWGKPGLIRTSHVRENIESFISNAKFNNVNF